jgi:hypothetical protein
LLASHEPQGVPAVRLRNDVFQTSDLSAAEQHGHPQLKGVEFNVF